MPIAHVINHTHWDREWFLTHEYTTAWIPALIDSISDLASINPDYEFLFDGQALVIEDLLLTRPEYRDKVHELISKGNLTIGPVYSQPDWRMVSGELHARNLQYGVGDAEALGGTADVAWLVDTFGHISQAPQILALAGVDSGYVWRGMPQMTPVFRWEGADGTQLVTVDLFGGYRNLYGITKTEDIAVDRLVAEVDKLESSYGELPIPLFDGYDLDTAPEDPVRYYADVDVPDRIEVVASSPREYIDAVMPFLDGAPTITGELLSGKYGSTFPGSLSARTYLKVLHHDAEVAMHRIVEPLATLATTVGRPYDGETYERLSRELLQNGVHDCLCGVSIDQVHERMERSYRRILAFADERQGELVTSLLQGFESGTYAVSTAALPTSGVQRADGKAFRFATNGVGVSQIATVADVEERGETTDEFAFSNEHFSVAVDRGGLSVNGTDALVRLLVRADAGDTYSSEPGDVLGELTVDGPIELVDVSALDRTVRLPMSFTDGNVSVRATVDARFDDGPLIDFTMTIDSDGTGFRVDAEFATGISASTAMVSMPFDVVERDHDDVDLFGHDVDPAMAAILMGQRETGRVTEFPFHDFVALTNDGRTAAVLAKGIRSYQSTADGQITVTLRRAAEWLALTDLQLRSGDAGPMMYVPGARSEREVTHRIGVAFLRASVDSNTFVALNESFHNPPAIATVDATSGDAQSWDVFSAPLPLTGLLMDDNGVAHARLFNPSPTPVTLERSLERRSLKGADLGESAEVRGKEIITTPVQLPAHPGSSAPAASVAVHTSIINRGGESRSQPSPTELDQLDARIDQLSGDLAVVVEELDNVDGKEKYILTHRQYVVERELLELRLSRELNERLLHSTSEVSIPDDADPVISELGVALNDLRVKRRIYDYVVQALAGS